MPFFKKFLLISLTFILANYLFVGEKVLDYIVLERPFKLISYSATFLVGTLIITLFACSKSIIKYLFLGICLLNSIAYLTYYYSTGSALAYEEFRILFEAKGMISDAFSGYYPLVVKAFLWHIPFIFAYLSWPAIKIGTKLTLATITIYIIIIIGFAGLLVKKQGRGLDGRPAYIVPTAQFALHSYLEYFGDPNKLYFHPEPRISPDTFQVTHSDVSTLIVVLDESILWDMIELNRPTNITPAILRFPNKNIINFGPSISYANCSDVSNYSLRKFARFDKEEGDLYGGTPYYLWKLSQQAGFTPYLIDAQADGIGHNFFTLKELEETTVIPAAELLSDADIVDLILEKRTAYPNEKQLFLVIKKGSHFPYKNEGFEPTFTPSMKSTVLTKASREEIINSYKNRIIFNTNRFFEEIYQKINYQDNTVIIYTSDHGQTFENPGQKSFHCDPKNPSVSEGLVPFLVVGPEHALKTPTLTTIEASQQIKSHYLLPPLIMSYLGYNDDDIRKFTEYETVLNPETEIGFVYRRAVPHFEAKAKKFIVDQEMLDAISTTPLN